MLKVILNEVRIDKLKYDFRAYEKNNLVNNQKLILFKAIDRLLLITQAH